MDRVFLTWTPVEARARLVNPDGTGAVRVTLRSVGTGRRPEVRDHPDAPGTPTLALSLPVSGAPVRFFVAGEFGRPSVALGDTTIEARGAGSLGVLGSEAGHRSRSARTPQTLTPAERDRFVAAFGT